MVSNKLIEGETSFRRFAENLPERAYKEYREMNVVQPINNYNLENCKKIRIQ